MLILLVIDKNNLYAGYRKPAANVASGRINYRQPKKVQPFVGPYNSTDKGVVDNAHKNIQGLSATDQTAVTFNIPDNINSGSVN